MKKELLNQWKKEEEASFSGWDFSHLEGRMIQPTLPWSYTQIAKELIRKSNSVLDMETGGGETFSSLAPFPRYTIAYEGYKPNVPIAKKRLSPLGVKVIECRDVKNLPFKDEEFDLVLNRHGAVNAEEVYRILKKNGTFFTQQVNGAEDMQDLVKAFKAKRKFGNTTLEEYVAQLEKAGFKILKSEKFKGKTEFKDIGAIVYYLKAIPWIVQGFNMNTHLLYLKKLQEKLDRNKKLEFDMARFMILAKK
jgi:ubiquinone/menaquinone biosynthesis C-methylase UbiE